MSGSRVHGGVGRCPRIIYVLCWFLPTDMREGSRFSEVSDACVNPRPLVRQDAGPAGALLERDSDSDEGGELEPYDEDADRWDDEDDVSPEDERALAAFMVRVHREG